MVHSLVDPAQGRGGRALEPSHFREVFCSHLMEIKKTCLMAKLPNCYEGHVLNAHAAYLLEALKVTSTLVALHLDSKGDTTTDVASCPVFVDDLCLSTYVCLTLDIYTQPIKVLRKTFTMRSRTTARLYLISSAKQLAIILKAPLAAAFIFFIAKK